MMPEIEETLRSENEQSVPVQASFETAKPMNNCKSPQAPTKGKRVPSVDVTLQREAKMKTLSESSKQNSTADLIKKVKASNVQSTDAKKKLGKKLKFDERFLAKKVTKNENKENADSNQVSKSSTVKSKTGTASAKSMEKLCVVCNQLIKHYERYKRNPDKTWVHFKCSRVG